MNMMTEKLTFSRGFTPILSGAPDPSLIHLPRPATIGLSAGDVPYIRPKLLVKEGDPVKIGTPLFTDKRDPSVQFVSPAAGRVKRVVYGKRRRLKEVIIENAPQDEWIEFDRVSLEEIRQMDEQHLVSRLKEGGLWQSFRQFPAGDTAGPDGNPAMIILSLNGKDIFSPNPARVVQGREPEFLAGMAVLERLTQRIVVTARKSSLADLSAFPAVSVRITHVTQDQYPAWNPGAVLYALKRTPGDNASWCIGLDQLLAMGGFLLTGRYPVERVVTLTRDKECRPHFITRQGVPVQRLSGDITDQELITTGQFNGRALSRESHLGFFENTVNVLSAKDTEEMFGFVRPGISKTSVSSTFLSALFRKPARVDGTLHGEPRACINCSYCESICPNGMMPQFIMKALMADEIEEALSLGLLDCCQCGLCSYTCPSKIELADIICNGITAYHKDKA